MNAIFEWSHVSTNYYWWRWYNTATSATMTRQPNLSMPQDLLIAKLKLINVDEPYIIDTIARYKIDEKLDKDMLRSIGNIVNAKAGRTSISFEQGGKFDLQLANPTLENRRGISANTARTVAENAIPEYMPPDNTQLVFDKIRLEYENGGSTES